MWTGSSGNRSSDIWKCCSRRRAVRKWKRAQLTVTESEWSSVCAIWTAAPSLPVIQLTAKAAAVGRLCMPKLTVCLCSAEPRPLKVGSLSKIKGDFSCLRGAIVVLVWCFPSTLTPCFEVRKLLNPGGCGASRLVGTNTVFLNVVA